jgi:hypothetical protein
MLSLQNQLFKYEEEVEALQNDTTEAIQHVIPDPDPESLT